jgi:4-amino-4-deoxy-L-arabinose transferase-like glycosyltransferase
MTVVGDEARKGSEYFGIAALLSAVAASHWRAVIALMVLALVAFLPGGFQIPPVDRDEARFAQATKQMIETGDFVDIRFMDEARYKKPVGIYWMQAAVVKLAEAVGVPRARLRIGLYRIPSLIGAIGAVLLTYWAGLAFVSRRAAFLAAAMMATSILLGVEARLAKTDAMLLMTVVATLGAMARAYLAEHGEPAVENPLLIAAIFWTALGVGILVKGPVVVMVVGLAAIALVAIDRSARWVSGLRPGIGVLWTIMLVLPWFLLIFARSRGSFFAEAIEDDMLTKIVSSQEGHGMPPGYYAATFFVAFFPGAILAGLAAPAVWRARAEPGCRFLLAWIVPSWVLFELFLTKLPNYVLPLYPALAILIAGVVDGQALSTNRWLVRGTVWWFILMASVALALIVLPISLGQGLRLLAWPFAAAAVIFALFAWSLYRVDGAEVSLVRAAAASVMLSFAAYGATFPAMRSLFPSVGLTDYVRGANCSDPGVFTTGFYEPSLVFLAGTSINFGFSGGSMAADFLNGGPCRFAFIDSRQERSFVQRADAIGLRYAPGPRIDGFNINAGQNITIAIYRSERAP